LSSLNVNARSAAINRPTRPLVPAFPFFFLFFFFSSSIYELLPRDRLGEWPDSFIAWCPLRKKKKKKKKKKEGKKKRGNFEQVRISVLSLT